MPAGSVMFGDGVKGKSIGKWVIDQSGFPYLHDVQIWLASANYVIKDILSVLIETSEKW